MRIFLEVSDRASFAEAARAMRLSPAAVTRAIAALEAELGLVLLSRTTRAVRPTERGAVYADRCRVIVAQVDEAGRAARGEAATPHGALHVTAPILFGRLHVLPIAEAMAAAHPALAVRLTFLDRVVHLVEEGFDAAIRIGALADSALVAVRLTEVRRVLVASPGYLREHGVPASHLDLRRHRIVSFDGIGSSDEWRFGADLRAVVRVTPTLSLNCAQAAVDAASRGAGIVRLLSYQVADAIAAGSLLPVLAALDPPPLPVSLVYPAAMRGSTNVRHFREMALQHFSSQTLAISVISSGWKTVVRC